MRCTNLPKSALRPFEYVPPLVLVSAALFVAPAVGEDEWVGRQFMPKEGCVIKIGTQEIPARGVALPYAVSHISGDWLWVGDGWVQKGRVVPLKQADEYYSVYLRTHPTSAWAHNLRGWTRYEKGDYDNALADYDAAVRLDPQDAVAYNNRGGIWQKKGEYEKALADYNAAIRIDPREIMGYNSLAWLLATCPADGKRDGKRAVDMARQACTLSGWKDPYLMDTLAASYAESGDFDEAVRWQTKAAAILPADQDSGKAIHERLALYRQKHPYREEPADGKPAGSAEPPVEPAR
ncbi:MAG TPA: tetratricopeptide repeat protein [Pirellulales bacterium]|nr:tetratricopeptide repeat protein [Pirellulales bacterium]